MHPDHRDHHHDENESHGTRVTRPKASAKPPTDLNEAGEKRERGGKAELALREGIVVVPKDGILPDGVVI